MVLSPPDTLARLEHDTLAPRGLVAGASNYTLLVDVGGPGSGVAAIYKPRRGEQPLWDFPEGTLCRREVAAYQVSVALGWGLVPPTVLRDGPLGEGSVQLFVPHDPRRHYFVLRDEPGVRDRLIRLALFDFLVNNADRKGSHVLEGPGGDIFGIDHGVTFHREPKLRTVIWDWTGAPIDPTWRSDLERFARHLTGPDGVAGGSAPLDALLAPEEVATLAARAADLAGRDRMPGPPSNRRPYPWPPL